MKILYQNKPFGSIETSLVLSASGRARILLRVGSEITLITMNYEAF
jgi:hypothetical protein